jgi:hypothetical protein
MNTTLQAVSAGTKTQIDEAKKLVTHLLGGHPPRTLEEKTLVVQMMQVMSMNENAMHLKGISDRLDYLNSSVHALKSPL